MKSIKKIVIAISGVNPSSGNRGVGALAVSTLHLLHEIAIAKNMNIEFILLTGNFGDMLIDVCNYQIKISTMKPANVFGIKPFIMTLLKPKSLLGFVKYLNIKFILCMGEGDSFSDIYGKKRFFSIDNHHKIARLLRKKYLLLPQTIGPFKDPKIKKYAKKSIEKSNMVFVRDFKSFKYVKDNTNQKNVFETVDVAFYMPYQKQSHTAGFIHVGLNISALLWNGGYTGNNQFCLKSNYQELIHNIIDYFIAIPEIKIHLVPHVVSANSHIENDYEVSYRLSNKYNNNCIILAPFFLTPIYAKNYIAGLDFFAGARMHSAIAAFSSIVPVFPMAYSRKFTGLFEDTLRYKFVGDMVNSDNTTVFDCLKKAFHTRKELKSIIQDRMTGVVEERRQLLINTLLNFID